jgi:hypothetical protein
MATPNKDLPTMSANFVGLCQVEATAGTDGYDVYLRLKGTSCADITVTALREWSGDGGFELRAHGKNGDELARLKQALKFMIDALEVTEKVAAMRRNAVGITLDVPA